VLTNFTAYINITKAANMQADYADLRFYNTSCNNGGSKLNYEIENYTATNAHFWVLIPSLAVGSTNISVYYKNSTEALSEANPPAAWDSSYVAVWHMNSTNPVDSKQVNNGTGTIVTANASALVDGGLNFNGLTTYVDAGNSSTLNLVNGGGTLSIEAWVKIGVYSSTSQRLIFKNISAAAGTYALTTGTYAGFTNETSFSVYNASGERIFTSNLAQAANTWYYAVGTYSNGTGKIYINGNDTTNATSWIALGGAPASNLTIGKRPDNTALTFFNGTMDEIRISNVARSPDWINQTFQLIQNQPAFVKTGAEQSQPILSVSFTTPTTNTTASTSQNWIAANATASATGTTLNNLTIRLYNGTGAQINITTSATSPLFINWTGLADGTYYWNATANTTDGVFNKTETRNVTITPTVPTIADLSLNATSASNLSTDNLTCNYALTGSSTTAAVAWYKNSTPLMLLYMPFEGNSTNALLDYSGSGNNAVSSSAAWSAAGGYGGNGTFVFNGTAYIALPQNVTEGINKFTIAVWIKTGASTTCTNLWQCPTITGTSTAGGGTNDFGIAVKNGNISMWTGLNGSSDQQLVSSAQINDSLWHFIVAANNGTIIRLYSDGINVGNLDSDGSALVAHRFDIGAIYYEDNTDSYFFNGSIDEVRIYNYSLSPEQISALYNNRTNLIVSQELEVNDTWQCRVTPFNASAAGTTSSSNNVTINANITVPAISVTLNSPANSYNSSSSLVNFNWTCSGSFGSFLANLTIDGVLNTSSIAATNNTAVNKSVVFADGSHNWSVVCWNGTTATTSNTYNFTVDTINPTIIFTTPTDNSSVTYNRSYAQINVTATDAGSGLKNITIYLYNSTGLYNSTNGTSSPLFINWTALPNGVYYWNATAFDNAGNLNKTETRNVTVNTASLAWNQSTLSLGSVPQGSSFSANATITATGNHPNTAVSNISGNGSSFTTATPTSLGTLNDTNTVQIKFNCSPSASQTPGYYETVFKVNSTQDAIGGNITASCSVTPILTVSLNSPANGTNKTVSPVAFNCSATDTSNMSNITLYLSSTGGSSGWTAYNDAGDQDDTLVYNASWASSGNVTNIGGNDTPGMLVRYSDNSSTGVWLNFSTAGSGSGVTENRGPEYTNQGFCNNIVPCYAPSGDAAAEFGTIINVATLTANAVPNTITGILSNLSNNKTYTLVLYGARGYYPARWCNYTISAVSSFTDNSSAGTTRYTKAMANDTISYNCGNNTVGYVAKWTGIVPATNNITFNVSGNSTRAYLTALKLSEEPSGTGGISWHANQTNNVSGMANSTTFSVNLSNGNYTWNCLARNIIGTMAFAPSNYTFTLDLSGDNPPEVTLASPENATTSNSTTIKFNFTATDDRNLVNATLYFCNVSAGACDAAGFIANKTINISGTSNATNITVVMQDNRTYWWNVRVCDNATTTQCRFAASNFTFTVSTSYIAPLPVWCGLHAIHTTYSDGTMTTNQSVANLKQYYDCGSTNDHDTSLTQTEWSDMLATSNTNNADNNFTYFFGVEWSGSQHIHYITMSPSSTLKSANDADFNTVAELATWLSSNQGVGQHNHPARSSGGTDFSSSANYNETWIPLVEMINQQSGTYYYHWNYYFNCSAGSGCTTYTNPRLPGQAASGTGWVKYALDKGIHLGFSCGNDYHDAYPLVPQCYVGLASPANWTRTGVYDTLKARHTWAAENKTTMNVTAYNGSGTYTMGDIFGYASPAPAITINYTLTASTGLTISNASLFYNGIIVNVTAFSGQQTVTGSFTQNLTESHEDYLFVQAIQSNGQRAWSSPMWINYTMTDSTNPTIQFTSPTDNSSTTVSRSYVQINVTASDANLKNITIYLYNSTGLYNSTNGTASPLFINWTSLPDGVYYFNATAFDTYNNLNKTETRNVTIDTANPTIAFTAPTDNSSTTVSRSYVQINVTATDTDLKNITIYLYNSTGLYNSTNGTASSLFANFTGLSNGVYYFNATAYDNAGNSNKTETRNVTIDDTPPGITFVPPTPDNGAYIATSNFTANVSSNENLSSCTLEISNEFSLAEPTISAGVTHTCYVLSNGNSTCYGNNSYGEANNYTGGNAIAVAAGYQHTCYLLSNGNSTCYGSNANGQLVNYTGGNAIAVSAGFFNTCYLLSNGNSSCLGSNTFNQSTSYTGGNAIAVSAGDYNTCYLLSNGNSTCYGSDSFPGQSTNYTGGNAIAISAGGSNTCYLLSNGSSTCYGGNTYGQSTNYTGGNAIAISAGGSNTCYLLSNGSSTCYGGNTYGQSTNYTGGNAIAISAGGDHTCYLLSNGNSTCYGYNYYKQTTNYTGGNAIAVSAGDVNTCYLLSNGNSTCYGKNDYNQSTNYTGGNIRISMTSISLFTPYAMQINNANGATAANYTVSGLSDGSHTYYATCSDVAGNSNSTETRNITIDTANPAISFTTPTDNSSATLNRNFIQINVTANDTNLKNITIYIYNSTGLYNSTNSTASPLFINWTGLPDGVYYFNATAFDNAGNLNKTETRNVTIDTANPTIQFTSPTDNSSATYSRNYVQINVSATDSSLKNVTIYLYNSTGGLVNSSNGTASPLFANFSVTVDGNYSFNATAYDTAGNTNKTETRNVTIDVTPPGITFVPPTPDNGSTIGETSVTINVSVTENVSSCVLNMSGRGQLWSNIRHLGISVGGRFDYNASYGVNTYSSFFMNARVPVSSGTSTTCYLISNGNSTCIGLNSDGQATNYTGGDAIAVSVDNYHTCYLRSNGNSTCYGYNNRGQATNYTGGDAIAVSVYNYHTCYLLSNGKSTCYGWNTSGETTSYTGGDAIAVSAGGAHTCYLLSNGNSTCYGNNGNSQSTNYTGGNAIAVSAGGSHTCYLLSNGKSTCYGDNTYSQSTNYGGGDAIAVSAGQYHTCYLLSNGKSTCYGDNTYSQSTNYGGGDAMAVSAGNSHTCYLLSNGNSTCYGSNANSQSTNYTGGDIRMPPLSLLNMQFFNMGSGTTANYTATNLTDGIYDYSVTCTDTFGNSNTTETRDVTIDTVNPTILFTTPTDNSSTTVSRSYVQINVTATDTNLKNVTIYLYNSTGLYNSTNGAASPLFINWTSLPDGVYYFNATAFDNANNFNKTETRNVTIDTLNPTIQFTTPTDNSSATLNRNFIQINVTATGAGSGLNNITIYIYNSTGLYNSTNGTASPLFINWTGLLEGLYYFNATAYDNAGNLNKTETRNVTIDATPPSIAFISPTPDNGSILPYHNVSINVTVSENASQCTLFLSDPSKLWSNLKHLNISGGRFDYNASIGVNNYSSFNMMNRNPIAAGVTHTCYVLSNGNSTCYGNNSQGQSDNYTGGDAMTMDAGNYHTCYLLSNGNSACYGSNSYGSGESTNYTGGNAIAVSAGFFYTCYLLSNGSSTCYGDNTLNQSDNYTGGDAIAVSAGDYQTCYLLSNGNSACYGYNSSGSTTSYTGGDAIAVAAGGSNTCYLLSNGNSTCYGGNTYGESTNYTGGNAIAVAAGGDHICYVLSNGNSTCYGYNDYGESTSYTGGDAIAVSAGVTNTCYLLSNGSSTCYGTDWGPGESTSYTGGNIRLPFADASYAMEVHNAGSLTTANYTLPALPDGNYAFLANCTDLAGNSNKTETRNITIDTVNPTIQFVTPTDNSSTSYSRSYIQINVSATDANLKNITIYLYNSTGALINSSNGTTSPLFANFSVNADGNYSFNATAYDTAGNLNKTETRNVTIDTINPAILFVAPTTNTSAAQSQNYIYANVSAMDANINTTTVYLYNSSGIYQTQNQWCYQETADASTSCGGLDTGSYGFGGDSWVDETQLYDGDWDTNSSVGGMFGGTAYMYINYTKPSNALNSSLWQVKKDIGSSVVESNYSIPSDCFAQNPLQFRITSFASMTGDSWVDLDCYNGTDYRPIYAHPITIDGDKVWEEAMWWNMNPISINFTSLPDDYYWWNATATDLAGNFNKTETRSTLIDTVNPAITFATPTDNSSTTVNRSYVQINVSATDTNLKNITIYLYNSTGALINSSNGTTSPLFANFSVTVDGNYSFNATAYDNAGNLNKTETRSVTVLAGFIPVSSCQVISAPGAYGLSSNLSGAPNAISGLNACILINASNVTFSCSIYSISNNGTASAAAIYIGPSALNISNVTATNCSIYDYSYGAYINGTYNSTIANSTVINSSSYGIYSSGAGGNLLSNVSVYGGQSFLFINTALNTTLANVTVGYNASWGTITWGLVNVTSADVVNGTTAILTPLVLSLNASNAAVSQLNSSATLTFSTDNCTSTILRIGSFTQSQYEILVNGTAMPYSAKSCAGPVSSFSLPYLSGSYTTGMNSAWQFIFGNITGALKLAKTNFTIVYNWNWGTGAKVYAKRALDNVNWDSLYAIGRNTTNGTSSGDFIALDSALGTGAYGDNVNATYSSNGTAPLSTYNASIYGRTVPYVPLANSSPFATQFTTGILWDSSTDTNGQFDASENENLVFFSEINGTRQGTWGDCMYEIRVPATFDTYNGYSTVELWLELS
jgi:hypothetical protein